MTRAFEGRLSGWHFARRSIWRLSSNALSGFLSSGVMYTDPLNPQMILPGHIEWSSIVQMFSCIAMAKGKVLLATIMLY